MKKLGRGILDNSQVIIARERSNRPMDKISEDSYILDDEEYKEKCPFCRGNEKYIEEETERISEDNKWIVKSVKNKYPIIDDNEINQIKGDHEVIIETYKHNGNFFNMTEEEFYNVLIIYKNRFDALSKKENIKYVCLFKNYLRKAGASLIHSHSQILSLPVIPIELENEYKVCDDFYKKMGINMYEHIIKEELNYKERVIHNSENFLIFIPEVCKFTVDIVILFKENIYFNEIDENKLNELSIIMKKLFTKIYEKDKNCPFNLYLHCHPLNEENDYKNKYNVHIHIVPRKFNFGGFELSTGMYISSKKSEDIAKNLKFD